MTQPAQPPAALMKTAAVTTVFGNDDGPGHADLTREEWMEQIHKDSIALYLANPSILDMIAIAEGTTASRVRFNLLQKMARPCGEGRATVSGGKRLRPLQEEDTAGHDQKGQDEKKPDEHIDKVQKSSE
mmetsp:Transcript_16371/g.28641  ORF Transcript_16371/g.28641 Transcript_16371/m.28641 type:complete len:129 (+) Transcript_16371:1574-1960(+)